MFARRIAECFPPPAPVMKEWVEITEGSLLSSGCGAPPYVLLMQFRPFILDNDISSGDALHG